MKKFSLFAFIVAIIAFSCKKDDNNNTSTTPTQLTIVSTDLGNAGDTIISNVDTSFFQNISFSPGQNLTWDFSWLVVDRIDTMIFQNPANTPGGSYFPTSNLAIQPEKGQPIYLYLNKTTSLIEGIGMWANIQGTEVHANYTDKPIFFKFPMTYNGSFNDSSYLTTIVNMNNMNIKTIMIQKIISTIDGSGIVKLPNNRTFNCLREKRQEITIDSIFVENPMIPGQWVFYQAQNDTTYSYNFYAKNQKWNIVSISVENFINNTVKEISYIK